MTKPLRRNVPNLYLGVNSALFPKTQMRRAAVWKSLMARWWARMLARRERPQGWAAQGRSGSSAGEDATTAASDHTCCRSGRSHSPATWDIKQIKGGVKVEESTLPGISSTFTEESSIYIFYHMIYSCSATPSIKLYYV